MLVEFSLTFILHHVWKKFQIYGAHIPRKYIDSRHFYSCPSPLKTPPKFLPSRPRQKEITHSPWQHSFENLLPPTAERGGRNYDLLYQNSVRKYEDDLEH